ncbi:MAG: lysophospholipid acyltransferase family protein [Algoriphagus sp.]|uniref:lysophospholipid acyltransferase family protein n=1 Tax=Algoriphagus sp. TaxID=1872435 RepID=UPI0026156241|nr:lysophospholipid acyltransferase family protein [Algoriphagus sp.]MDG1276750.1 lysophospholipid acyltransferase family protein [Algoriphagus sp.]
MNKAFRYLYTFYAGILFMISFLIIFPFLLLCIWIPGWKRFGRKINRYWARAYFSIIFLPVEIQNNSHLVKGKPYIFLANHFSYLDIPMMGFIPGDVLFVGKASIRKAPLFGYYFKSLHIAVDRERLKSRAETLKRASEALDSGSGIIIFPEGGIYTKNPPKMIPFKNGAFRLAIDKQIPIIPVTLSYNHLILPDDGNLLLRRRNAKMILHEPILAKEGESEESIKATCFQVIQNQLDKDNNTL